MSSVSSHVKIDGTVACRIARHTLIEAPAQAPRRGGAHGHTAGRPGTRGGRGRVRELTVEVSGRLLRLAYGILRDRALAEDATQRTLLNIWRTLPRLRDPARFEAWSCAVLVRACADEARHARRSLPALLPTPEPSTSDEISGVIDREQLERGFARLSFEHRAVIVLHHYFDLSLPATAEALGVSVGTAKSRLNRAMTRLRLALHADGPGARDSAWEATP
jgi:RNA polymerase sigma-70 factor, ECF subfamily